jgi:hypothetical protein
MASMVRFKCLLGPSLTLPSELTLSILVAAVIKAKKIGGLSGDLKLL